MQDARTAPSGCQEKSFQSEFHLHRNQCDGALHPKWMLGEADCIRSLNQKPLVLSTSIKAEMNFGKKKASEFSEGGKGMVREVDEGENREICISR